MWLYHCIWVCVGLVLRVHAYIRAHMQTCASIAILNWLPSQHAETDLFVAIPVQTLQAWRGLDLVRSGKHRNPAEQKEVHGTRYKLALLESNAAGCLDLVVTMMTILWDVTGDQVCGSQLWEPQDSPKKRNKNRSQRCHPDQNVFKIDLL